MNTPVKYPGSKEQLVNQLLPLIPPPTIFIEPFCGGAAVFFAKPKAERNWLNLVNLYEVLRSNPQKLVEAINSIEISKKNYNYFKTDLKPKNNFERALRWLYLDLTSYPDKINLLPKFLEFDAIEEMTSSRT